MASLLIWLHALFKRVTRWSCDWVLQWFSIFILFMIRCNHMTCDLIKLTCIGIYLPVIVLSVTILFKLRKTPTRKWSIRCCGLNHDKTGCVKCFDQVLRLVNEKANRIVIIVSHLCSCWTKASLLLDHTVLKPASLIQSCPISCMICTAHLVLGPPIHVFILSNGVHATTYCVQISRPMVMVLHQHWWKVCSMAVGIANMN